jgi:hypothetical protein
MITHHGRLFQYCFVPCPDHVTFTLAALLVAEDRTLKYATHCNLYVTVFVHGVRRVLSPLCMPATSGPIVPTQMSMDHSVK